MRSEEWRPAAAALEPSFREVGKADCRALRPGREELAVTDPDPRKRVPVTEARHPEPKIAAVRAPGGGRPPYGTARRLKRLACRVTCRPNGCLASIRTSLGAPPPRIRVSEATKAKPGRKKRAAGTRWAV